MQTEHGRLFSNDRAGLIELFAKVSADAGSWLNIAFVEIEDDSVEPDSAFFSFLAARGPANPLATLMRENSTSPLSVGIQHRAGTKAAEQLREEELFAPDSTRVRQDHPRRGLVLEWPDSASADELADWLLPAMRILNRARSGEALVWSWSRNDR